MNSRTFAPLDRLDGKVAVITGGNGAIGSATARRLAALGARIVLLQNVAVSDVAPLLHTLGGSGHLAFEASVSDSASLKDAAALVQSQTGGASILINCAGYTKAVAAADLEGLTDELIDGMFAVNWRGSFASIRAFAPQLKATRDAVIVNVSSIASFTAVGSNIAYSASKAGIDVMTKALAKALSPEIRVLAISPGIVDTAFVPGRDESFNDRVGASLPLRRVGTADDVAAAIVACCTALRYATGSIIVSDGGRHLSA